MEKTKKSPPVILVKTWIDIMRSSESDIARERAKNMLIGAFGDMQRVADFMKDNRLK